MLCVTALPRDNGCVGFNYDTSCHLWYCVRYRDLNVPIPTDLPPHNSQTSAQESKKKPFTECTFGCQLATLTKHALRAFVQELT